MVTSKLKIFTFDVYASLYLSNKLSFVTSFLATNMSPKILLELFLIYTLMGESVVAQRVCQSYPMSILHKFIPCVLLSIIWLTLMLFLGNIGYILLMPP